jgi:hypothetical protein
VTDVETIQAFHCPDCDALVEEDSIESGLYECGECGDAFTRENSADGESNRCPNCNKFAAKIADHGCPECGTAELEETEAVLDDDGELVSLDEWNESGGKSRAELLEAEDQARQAAKDARTAEIESRCEMIPVTDVRVGDTFYERTVNGGWTYGTKVSAVEAHLEPYVVEHVHRWVNGKEVVGSEQRPPKVTLWGDGMGRGYPPDALVLVERGNAD